MEYSGPERRKTMNTEINEMKVEIAVLSANVKEWMNGTLQYRLDLCKKQDRLLVHQEQAIEKITNLPCAARAEITKGIKAELNWIRGLVVLILLALAGLWLK